MRPMDVGEVFFARVASSRRFAGAVYMIVAPAMTQMPVADQFPAFFVPESERERFEARPERDRLDLLKQRVRLVTFLDVVIGNARAEMVDVMEADVAGKPLEDARQFVKRTALQRRRRVTPVLAAFPVDVFELML